MHNLDKWEEDTDSTKENKEKLVAEEGTEDGEVQDKTAEVQVKERVIDKKKAGFRWENWGLRKKDENPSSPNLAKVLKKKGRNKKNDNIKNLSVKEMIENIERIKKEEIVKEKETKGIVREMIRKKENETAGKALTDAKKLQDDKTRNLQLKINLGTNKELDGRHFEIKNSGCSKDTAGEKEIKNEKTKVKLGIRDGKGPGIKEIIGNLRKNGAMKMDSWSGMTESESDEKRTKIEMD